MNAVHPRRDGATNRLMVTTLALAMLLASVGTSIANIALPALSQDLDAPFQAVQWVIIAYLAALTACSVIAGRLGDRHGLKPMLLAGLGLFILGSLACGLAGNLAVLIVARALQGAGAAFLMTLAMALMRETVVENRLGWALGLLGTMSALGTAMGPAVGGLVLATTGWRGVFLILVPLGLLALLLAARTLPAREGGTTTSGSSAWAGAALPWGLLANLLVAAVMMTTLVVGPFYLGHGLGLGVMQVGMVMTVGPAISIISGVPLGHTVDRWGARRTVGAGLIMLGTGAFALAFLPQAFGIAGYVLAIAVLTPGYQLFQAANNASVLTAVAAERRGIMAGWLGLSRNLGLILGASAMGAIFALGVGTNDFARADPVAMGDGLRLAFVVAGGLAVVALGLALRPRAT